MHLVVLKELGLSDSWSARGSSLWHMGVDGVSVTRCHRGSIVGKCVEVCNGVPGDHIGELRCDVFRGGSLHVLFFLVELEIVRWVVGGWWLECGWEGFGHAMCLWFRRGCCRCR